MTFKQLFTSCLCFAQPDKFQVDDKSQEIVLRKGKFTPSPTSRLHNDHLYQGSENDIVTTRIYSQDWICDFELSYYPFDVQFCKMIFTLKAILSYYIYITIVQPPPNHLFIRGPLVTLQRCWRKDWTTWGMWVSFNMVLIGLCLKIQPHQMASVVLR